MDLQRSRIPYNQSGIKLLLVLGMSTTHLSVALSEPDNKNNKKPAAASSSTPAQPNASKPSLIVPDSYEHKQEEVLAESPEPFPEGPSRTPREIPYDEAPRLAPALDLLLSGLIWVSNIDDASDKPYRQSGDERLSEQEQATRFMTLAKGIIEMYGDTQPYDGTKKISSSREAIVGKLEPHRKFGTNPITGLNGLSRAIERGETPRAVTLQDSDFSNPQTSTATSAFEANRADFTQSTLVEAASTGSKNSDALLGGVFASMVDFLKEPAFAELFKDSIVHLRKYRNELLQKEVISQIKKTEAGKVIPQATLEATTEAAEKGLTPVVLAKTRHAQIDRSIDYVSDPRELALLGKDPSSLSKSQRKKLNRLLATLRRENKELKELEAQEAMNMTPKAVKTLKEAVLPTSSPSGPEQSNDVIDHILGKAEAGMEKFAHWDNILFEMSSNSEYIIIFLKILTSESVNKAKQFRRIKTFINAFERRLNNQMLPALFAVGDKVSALLNQSSGPEGDYYDKLAELMFQDYLRKLPVNKKKSILIDIMRGAVRQDKAASGKDSFQRSLAILIDHFGPAFKQLLQAIANSGSKSALTESFTAVQQYGKAVSWEEVMRHLEHYSPKEAVKLKALVARNPGYSVNSGKAFRGFKVLTKPDPNSDKLVEEFFRVMRFDFLAELQMDGAILQQLIPKLVNIFLDDNGRPASPGRVRRILKYQIDELRVEGDLVQTVLHQKIASQRLGHKKLIERPSGNILIEFYVPQTMPAESGDKVQRMELLRLLSLDHIRQYEGVQSAISEALHEVLVLETLRPLSPEKMQAKHPISDPQMAKANHGYLYTDPHLGNVIPDRIEQKADYLHVRVPIMDHGLALYEKLHDKNLKNIAGVVIGCSFNDQKLISESLWRMRNPEVTGQTKEKLNEGIKQFISMQRQSRVRFYTPEEMIGYLDRNEYIEVQPWLYMTQRAFTTLENNFQTGAYAVGGEPARRKIEELNWKIAQEWYKDLVGVALDRQPIFSKKFPFVNTSNIVPNLTKRAFRATTSMFKRDSCKDALGGPKDYD